MLKSLKLEMTAAIALLISTPATAAPLENWRFDPVTNQLEVTVPAGITPRYSLLAQPTRIVLDLPNTQIGTVKSRGTYSGAVREIRVSQLQPNVARIVLELAPNVVLSNPQAQLQQIKGSEQTRDRLTNARWTLRPVLAASAPSANTQAVFNALRPIQTAPAQTASAPIAQAPTSANDFDLPPAPPTINSAPSVSTPDLPPASSTPLPTAPAVMPPLQPSVTPTAPLPAGAGNSAGSSLLFPDAPVRSTTQSNPLQLPEVNPSLAIPNSFPSVGAPTAQPTVSVPQLDRRSASQGRRSIPTESQSNTVSIEDTPVPAQSRIIKFGQPLP
ncbi:MAG: hypothetical protein C4288_01055 [Leptolyngbya sp. ERB_1_1]